MSTSTVSIQTFVSFEELRKVPGFVENNPLTKATYRGIVGDYHLNEDVSCCFQKENGNLCLHLHKHGWLVELINGTVTLLGSDCASMQFDLDSKLIADRDRYKNEQRRKDRLAAIVELIDQKVIRLEQLSGLRTRLESLKDRVTAFGSKFGPTTRRQLVALARSEKPDVLVKAVKLRPYLDDQGWLASTILSGERQLF